MNASTLQDRVRSLIDKSGQTQEGFGTAIGLDATKLSKALNGHRRFTSLELARIADAHRVSVDWLLSGTESQVAARVSADGSPVAKAVAGATQLAESRDNAIFLGKHAELPKPPAFASPLWTEQGAELAAFALKSLDPAAVSGDSQSFASAIEQAFGFDVSIASLDSGCDGLALASEGGARILTVATTGNPTRQRFTMAHELAHLLCGDDQGLHVDENVMAGSRGDSSEIRANAFAAALLMPEGDLHQRFDDVRVTRESFSQAVMDLKVSPSSLAWRLMNLSLISAQERADLGGLRAIDCAGIAGQIDNYAAWVEASTQPRPPFRLLSDLMQLYSDGTTSLRPLANLLEIPVDVLRRALAPHLDDSPTSEADDFAP